MPEAANPLVILKPRAVTDWAAFFVRELYGPDDDVLEIDIDESQQRVSVLTERGNRFRIDALPRAA